MKRKKSLYQKLTRISRSRQKSDKPVYQMARRIEALIEYHPFLVIEVDITSPSTQRREIYQTLGVPEVWLYTKSRGLVIYELKSDSYHESNQSVAFPQISVVQLNKFLEQRQTQGENQVIRKVRNLIKNLS